VGDKLGKRGTRERQQRALGRLELPAVQQHGELALGWGKKLSRQDNERERQAHLGVLGRINVLVETLDRLRHAADGHARHRPGSLLGNDTQHHYFLKKKTVTESRSV
jgi:hypothetical protein